MSIHKKSLPIAMLCLGGTVLAACGDDTRQAFGLDRRVPDEFAVVSRAPLSMPPSYALQPPRPGAPRPQEGTPRDQAASAVFGVEVQPATFEPVDPSSVTPAEGALLRQAGADGLDPDIRRIVDQETTDLVEEDEGFVQRLLFWQDPLPAGLVVDPQAEAARLATAAATGEPLNEGEVPTIERRERAPLEGVLDGLFDF